MRYHNILNQDPFHFKYCHLVFKQSSCEKDRSLCGNGGVCIPDYQDDTVQCKCNDGYTGKPCSKYYLPNRRLFDARLRCWKAASGFTNRRRVHSAAFLDLKRASFSYRT